RKDHATGEEPSLERVAHLHAQQPGDARTSGTCELQRERQRRWRDRHAGREGAGLQLHERERRRVAIAFPAAVASWRIERGTRQTSMSPSRWPGFAVSKKRMSGSERWWASIGA